MSHVSCCLRPMKLQIQEWKVVLVLRCASHASICSQIHDIPYLFFSSALCSGILILQKLFSLFLCQLVSIWFGRHLYKTEGWEQRRFHGIWPLFCSVPSPAVVCFLLSPICCQGALASSSHCSFGPWTTDCFLLPLLPFWLFQQLYSQFSILKSLC